MIAPRSALFLPASNARAVAKARTLAPDLLLLDLEDAVAPHDKARAREMAVDAVATGFAVPAAIRVNAIGTPWHDDDVAAVAASAASCVVLPKVESGVDAARVARTAGRPLLAMIETPAGVLAATGIAHAEGVVGLIAGTNDLAAAMRLPPAAGRIGLMLALQTIVLAARAAGAIAIDGVWNQIEDEEGLAAECMEGRAVGFDGKTLIHPSQIDPANRLFGPSDEEVEDARALVAAATAGVARFRGRMVEEMHVAAARRLLARTAGKPGEPAL